MKQKQQNAEGTKTTVTVLVPRAFKLTLSHDKVIPFEQGVQEMDPELLDHWYVKAHSVRPYEPKEPAAPAAPNPAKAAPIKPAGPTPAELAAKEAADKKAADEAAAAEAAAEAEKAKKAKVMSREDAATFVEASVNDVTAKLAKLSDEDLMMVEEAEKAGTKRATLLVNIEKELGKRG